MVAIVEKMWPKLRFSRPSKSSGGRRAMELPMAKCSHTTTASTSMASPLNVNEEYRRAMRTKSYTDIWSKVRHHHILRSHSTPIPNTPRPPPASSTATTATHHDDDDDSSATCTTASSPFSFSTANTYSHLPDYLDPTDPDALLLPVRDLRVRSLLLDFFSAGDDACRACASLLASLDRIRHDHAALRRLILGALNGASTATGATAQLRADLASYADAENPLSDPRLIHFRRVHAFYPVLIARLTHRHRKLARRVWLLRVLKHAAGVLLVVTCGAVTVALLAVTAHGAIAVVAACFPLLALAGRRWSPICRLSRTAAQVDAAKKGAYIMGRDFDTMSRMVARLRDEIEHGKDVVRMFLRKGTGGGGGVKERYVLQEVAREMEENKVGFGEQIDELEEHVYWCLKTINRTRRLVVQELGSGGAAASSPAESTGGNRLSARDSSASPEPPHLK